MPGEVDALVFQSFVRKGVYCFSVAPPHESPLETDSSKTSLLRSWLKPVLMGSLWLRREVVVCPEHGGDLLPLRWSSRAGRLLGTTTNHTITALLGASSPTMYSRILRQGQDRNWKGRGYALFPHSVCTYSTERNSEWQLCAHRFPPPANLAKTNRGRKNVKLDIHLMKWD